MSDLISRSALIGVISKMSFDFGNDTDDTETIIEMVNESINNQPAAYDVDKVVRDLEQQKICVNKSCDAISQEDCNKYTDCGLCIMDKAIDIVKRWCGI